MTEPIPFWEDWEFWRVIVTGLFALIGFFLAAWAKYGFDLRLDRVRRNHEKAAREEEKAVLAIALRVELNALMDEADIRINHVNRLKAAPKPPLRRAFGCLDIPPKTVFDSNNGRLGEFGRAAATSIITAHARADHTRYIAATDRALPQDNPTTASDIEIFLGNLREIFQRAAEGVNALDAFLGEAPSYPDPARSLEERERSVSRDSESKASTK